MFNFILFIDKYFNDFLTAIRNPLLTKLTLGFTLLGDWKIISLFTLITIYLFWRYYKYENILLIPFIGTIILSELSKELLKIIFQRPRPENALSAAHSFSLPSGHAMIAVVFYGFIAYFFLCLCQKNKISVLGGVLFIILSIGFSRLYLGVHYLSDILAGYLLGVFWLLLGIFAIKKLTSKNQT